MTTARERHDPQDEQPGEVRELTSAESWALFDDAARHYLGISGEEFLRRWDAGAYAGPAEDTRVTTVAMLMPFVREVHLPS